jgi:hypothetical protein
MSRSVGFAQLNTLAALICDTLDRLRITDVVCVSVAAHSHEQCIVIHYALPSSNGSSY